MHSGGGETGHSGLSRFRSAPASWLEALLEDEEEDPLKQNQCLTQLLAGGVDDQPPPTTPSRSSSGVAAASPSGSGLYGPGSASGNFTRQNSTPVDFLRSSGVESDGYFTNYEILGDFDYLSADMDASVSHRGKMRAREVESSLQLSADYPPHHLKMELSSGGLSRRGGGGDADTEKLLDGSGAFRVRAKRGFATHPRSIAERVRRTRISDRIRKLQELVPNMDKQTNTADMLDEALEYVKFLQQQIQDLSEQQKNCTCLCKEQ